MLSVELCGPANKSRIGNSDYRNIGMSKNSDKKHQLLFGYGFEQKYYNSERSGKKRKEGFVYALEKN
ncbi:hypothetical protein SDC9_113131 [bioreactor metagenome]|uniref:Uncharacterized protein n=1 Tax=bioreactor metagenome TaxID=1076179 RepID=A0A645BWU3_9ZZZZ